MKHSQLADLLQRTELFTPEQVETLLLALAEAGAIFTTVVVEKTGIKEELFLEKLAGVMGLPFMRLSKAEIAQELLAKVPPKAVFQYNIMPVAEERGALRIATANPLQPGLIDAMRLVTGGRIKLALSPASDIEAPKYPRKSEYRTTQVPKVKYPNTQIPKDPSTQGNPNTQIPKEI